MAIRPVSTTAARILLPTEYNSGAGTAYYGGFAVKVSSLGIATIAGGTDAIRGVIPGVDTVKTALESIGSSEQASLIDVFNADDEIFEADVHDTTGDTFGNTTTSDGNATGTTLIDTDRTEAASVFRYGTVYLYSTKQHIPVASVSSTLFRLTLARPATNTDGTAHAILSGEKYAVTALNASLTGARLSTVTAYRDCVDNEAITGGAIQILSMPTYDESKATFTVRCNLKA